MQAALKRQPITVEDYLDGEEASDIKHEYVGGAMFAMAGATTEHNQIALNMAVAARSHLKGKPCRVFMSDVKVRMELNGEEFCYYPDVMVACDSRDTHRQYIKFPKLLVEVSSESTERLDRREKRWAYQAIETLEEYVIVAQDRVEVTVFRRAGGWQPEVIIEVRQTISFESIGLALPISAIYEGVIG